MLLIINQIMCGVIFMVNRVTIALGSVGVLGIAVLYTLYNRENTPTQSKFSKDFVASVGEFNRTLTFQEKQMLKSPFPSADLSKITFLGTGLVKPRAENCNYYECMDGTAHIYDLSHKYVGSMTAAKGQVAIMEDIYTGHPVAATYNCIGHALGVSKWLDPREITSYIKNNNMTKYDAIDAFLKDQKAIYNNTHQSNFDHILDNLHSVQNSSYLSLIDKEHNVAFFFNSTSGDCLHGARYLEKHQGQDVGGSWTSKLGSSMTIAHGLQDLLGGVYGDDICYAEI